MEDRIYQLGLQFLTPGGSRRYKTLVDYFGSARAAWNAPDSEWLVIPGLTTKVKRELIEKRRKTNLKGVLKKLNDLKAKFLTIDDNGYPENLKSIYDPPPVLFVLGKFLPKDELAVAVVGSRKATPYGLAIAEKLARDLARAGVTVVSGMARGIDSAAHRGALAVGGRTVAVLGSGIDIAYPRENKRLMYEIANSGAVISEFPPGMQPEAWHFPVRNRIISGLSRAVVVVEAGEKSGALITADLALEQGKDVMAVPGSVKSVMSRGTHRLIKDGAKLVENAGDIIEELEASTSLIPDMYEEGKDKVMLKLNKEERAVCEVLSSEPVTLDYIIQKTSLSSQQVMSALLFLEIKGMVKQFPGKKYAIF